MENHALNQIGKQCVLLRVGRCRRGPCRQALEVCLPCPDERPGPPSVSDSGPTTNKPRHAEATTGNLRPLLNGEFLKKSPNCDFANRMSQIYLLVLVLERLWGLVTSNTPKRAEVLHALSDYCHIKTQSRTLII